MFSHSIIFEKYINLSCLKNSKVFFAGEACDQKYHMTTHGAYQSGKKAAEKIADEI